MPLSNNPPVAGAPATCHNPATLDEFACWVAYEHSWLTYVSLLGRRRQPWRIIRWTCPC